MKDLLNELVDYLHTDLNQHSAHTQNSPHDRQPQEPDGHEEHGNHGHPHPSPHQPAPLLSVADFDGDGVVNEDDLSSLEQRIAQGQAGYHPLYDLDANGVLDSNDLQQAESTVESSVSQLDQQVAQATQATMKYYGPGGIEQALQDGYVPTTEEAKGHGSHYYNFGLAAQIGNDKTLDVTQPVGLNFNDRGELIAVFYIHIPRVNGITVDPSDDFPPTTSFEGLTASDWHIHRSSWASGLGTTDPKQVSFEEDVPQLLVINRLLENGTNFFPDSDEFYLPKFYMLHGWFHSLNPSGTFAITNPLVSPYGVEELGAHHEGQHSGSSAPLIAGTDWSDPLLLGTRQADRINGFDGNDRIWARAGDDLAWGGKGDDILRGGRGNDMLYGGWGKDWLHGGWGKDRLHGGADDDRIKGGWGNDIIRGGIGNDTVWGGRGSDIFVLAADEGADTIKDFSLEDRFVLTGGLSFGSLTLDSHNILFNDELLATLSGFDTSQLGAEHFMMA
ncbi:hypothetical protein [Acaryochloris sp. IP29b_bin.137]|uniref:hypothetical protein n=1 Tax=Acaryochloris sp. IP29b_bin.137 TaxID=2969217 RepID=UPI002609D6AE|nr:hypothetical protein [Acaryochloris sp. IP29b_bin.137]